jgi:hypothetical protein
MKNIDEKNHCSSVAEYAMPSHKLSLCGRTSDHVRWCTRLSRLCPGSNPALQSWLSRKNYPPCSQQNSATSEVLCIEPVIRQQNQQTIKSQVQLWSIFAHCTPRFRKLCRHPGSSTTWNCRYTACVSR